MERSRIGFIGEGPDAYSSGPSPLVGGDLSNLAQSWVWRFSRSANLDRFVLLYLAYRYNEDKQRAWPSIKTIAEGCGISTSSVKRSLLELQRLGELKVTSRPSDDGDFNSNFYELPATQSWIEEVIRNGRVYREGGRFPENQPRSQENPEVGSTGATNSLGSNSTIERKELSLPLLKEEPRPQPKPVKEPKVRRGLQRTVPIPRFQINIPMRLPKPKPPQDWDWFAGMWHRYTEVFPVGTPNCWEELENRLKYFSKEQIESRLSRWLEQRDGRITGWTALDFLRDCALMLDEKEAGDIQGIVNEE